MRAQKNIFTEVRRSQAAQVRSSSAQLCFLCGSLIKGFEKPSSVSAAWQEAGCEAHFVPEALRSLKPGEVRYLNRFFFTKKRLSHSSSAPSASHLRAEMCRRCHLSQRRHQRRATVGLVLPLPSTFAPPFFSPQLFIRSWRSQRSALNNSGADGTHTRSEVRVTHTPPPGESSLH